MSIARRDAKWRKACLRCAGQTRPPVQRATASPGGSSMCEPHSGQTSGQRISGCKGLPTASAGRRSGSAETTSGMTSPARRTITVSPTRMSLRAISIKLCSVALVTVTPPTNTGSKRATGVTAPVRPICTSMASTLDNASSAGNL